MTVTRGRWRRARSRDLLATSARGRLTLVIAGMLVATGLSILGTVLLVMRLLPPAVVTTEVADVGESGDVDLVPHDGEGGEAARPWAESVAPGADAPGADGVVTDGVEVALIQLRTVDELLGQLLVTSAVVLVVALALGSWLSWVVAGRLLRPVVQLTDAAREIDHGSLHPSLDLGGRRDEIGRLAGTMRDMLLRLDRSYQAQRRFAANASHELRTPLATTQAVLDVALAAPDAVDVQQLAARLRALNARSAATVSALLTLADAASGDRDDEPVDLAALVATAVSTVAGAAQEAGSTVTTDLAPVSVRGDPVLLDVLVGNLVGNAVRHGRPGGTVHVRLHDAVLVVENDGDVLDPALVSSFTEPFFRGAGRVAGSHGLGLALVAAVAEAHGANLGLAPRAGGGLVATVTFWAAPEGVRAGPGRSC